MAVAKFGPQMPQLFSTSFEISSPALVAIGDMKADNGYYDQTRKQEDVSMNPAVDTRRVRRLEAQLDSLSSENDKAVQNLAKAVAELMLRVANLELKASGFGEKLDVTNRKV